MGFRDRQVHRQQQKQQSLGQGYQSEQRISLPAPVGMNTKENPSFLQHPQATLLEDAIPQDGGLYIQPRPRARAYASATSVSFAKALVTYNGCGSTSAEMWLFAGTNIYNVGDVVDAGATLNSASAQATPGNDGSFPFMWTEYNKTIIMVNGSAPLKWNRASAWEVWSATASGGNITQFWGINKFKNRLFGWEKEDSKFWYGSTDQVLGTFNSFDLSPVINGNLAFMANMTRDGGAGPDDYAVFVSEQGDAAVYAGTDPGDANAWSLVGTYKIGRPLSRSSFVNYGQQLVVLCEDDFYFLPQDFVGKRTASVAAERRVPDRESQDAVNAVYWPEGGLIAFSEGSCFSTKADQAFTTLTFSSTTPYFVRGVNLDGAWANNFIRPQLAVYKGGLYCAPPHATDVNQSVVQVRSDAQATRNTSAKIRTAPIPTNGRTNISLVNPVFQTTVPATASADESLKVIYRTAVVYDQEPRRYATASANAWVTTTASTNSDGLWVPGYGTGDAAQIYIEVLSVSASAAARVYDLYLTEIKITTSDTGGI